MHLILYEYIILRVERERYSKDVLRNYINFKNNIILLIIQYVYILVHHTIPVIINKHAQFLFFFFSSFRQHHTTGTANHNHYHQNSGTWWDYTWYDNSPQQAKAGQLLIAHPKARSRTEKIIDKYIYTYMDNKEERKKKKK